MTTLTTTTKPTPWKATARYAGIVFLRATCLLAKATWWITKHSFLLIIGFWVVVGKTAWSIFLDSSDSNNKSTDPAMDLRVSGIDHLEDEDGYNHRQKKFLI